MKAFIIKNEFPAGDCWDCPLALANLNECTHDDYCPLHEVVDMHIVKKASRELYEHCKNNNEIEMLDSFLESDMAKHIGNKIKEDGLCTITSEICNDTKDYKKEMTIFVVNPKEAMNDKK